MVVVFALSTCVSTLVGGLVALRNRDRMHLILGFTAGVLLGLVAFDLLPEVFALSESHTAGVPTVMLTFAGGFLGLHVIERSVALHGAHEGEYGDHAHQHPTVGLVSALALCGHSFMDGLAIGLGFQAGTAIGLAVAIAVVAHDFADGLNTVSIMLSHANSTRRSATLLALDATAPLLRAPPSPPGLPALRQYRRGGWPGGRTLGGAGGRRTRLPGCHPPGRGLRHLRPLLAVSSPCCRATPPRSTGRTTIAQQLRCTTLLVAHCGRVSPRARPGARCASPRSGPRHRSADPAWHTPRRPPTGAGGRSRASRCR